MIPEEPEISPNLRRWALASLLTGFSILVNAEAVQAARALEFGDTGADVVALQDQLKQTGDFPYGTRSTGYLGSITEAAVVEFQKRRGLTPDGVVGMQTQNALNTPTLKLGSRGDYVYQLQAHLLEQGYPLEPDNVLAVDGVFGQQTQTAVLQFQAKQGLEQDGIVGPETHMTLLQSRIIQTSVPSDSSTIHSFLFCTGDRQDTSQGAETDQRIVEAIAQLDQSDPNLLVSALDQLCFYGRKPLAQQFISPQSGYSPDKGDLIEPALKTAIPKLTALLNHPRSVIRKYAVLTLGGINSRLPAAVATPKIIKLLNDSNLEVKQAAIEALDLLDVGLTVKAPVVMDALNQQLQSADLTIRARVESVFNRTPRTPPSISVQEAQAEVDRRINALIAQLNDPESDILFQQKVIHALGWSGPAAYPAIPALLKRLANPELELSVIQALSDIGDYAVETNLQSSQSVNADLQRTLEAGGINIQEQAAIALRDAVEPVSQKLRDSSVADAAAIALGSWESTTLQSASPQTISALVEVINRESLLKNSSAHYDHSLGVNTIAALANTGTTDPAVIRRLIQFLESEDFDTRIKAIQALGRIGATAQSAVDPLMQRLQTPIPNTYTGYGTRGYEQMQFRRQRIQSLGAISKIQPEAIASFNLKEFVLQAFQSASRKQDALSFSQLEPRSVPGLNQTLRRILSDSSNEYRIRYSAAFVLAFSDPPPDTSPETIQVLSGIVNNSNDDFDVRWISATVLAALGQDMDTFFTQHFLVNSTQAQCPEQLFIDTYLSFCEYSQGGGRGRDVRRSSRQLFPGS